MKIASVIADLLYVHECIVIPGLGGFITKNHPASVHPVKDQFKPPYKEIVFNPYLRANDGVLLGYIAQQENISYNDAKAKLDRFVLKCLNEMDKGNKISFRNIGRIYYDANKQVVFQADETQNYLAESFGLTDFVSPAIKREGLQEKIERTIQQQREEKKQPVESTEQEEVKQEEPKKDTKKKSVRGSYRRKKMRQDSVGRNTIKTQVWIIILLIVGAFAVWGFMNRGAVSDYYASHASWFPFFYASPNEYVVRHIDQIPVDKLIKDAPSTEKFKPKTPENQSKQETAEVIVEDNPEIVPSEPETVIAVEPEVVDVQQEEPVEQLPSEEPADNPISETEKILEEPKTEEKSISEPELETDHYFIVAGVFAEEANAHRMNKKLQDEGFQSKIIGKTKTGKWRVVYESHSDKATADSRLIVIREKHDVHAWLLKL